MFINNVLRHLSQNSLKHRIWIIIFIQYQVNSEINVETHRILYDIMLKGLVIPFAIALLVFDAMCHGLHWSYEQGS